MGEVAKMAVYAAGSEDFDDRVLEWEDGLPTAGDLTPLSQALIPRHLATAFNIRPETSRSKLDVDRASRETFSSLRGGKLQPIAENSFKPYDDARDLIMIEEEEGDGDGDGGDRSDSRKIRRIEATEDVDADSASRGEFSNSINDQAARALRRPRLVWTPQLHRRFVDVVTHLGLKSAVPKTIMQLMNVEGLTRENVASHLQKYRLYLRRNQGPSYEAPSSPDQMFASTPATQSLHQMQDRQGMVPMFGIGHGQMYGMMQHRDWSGNTNGSVVSYPHAINADK